MSNTHKIGHRLLLVAEVLTKIEPLAPFGYALKVVGYGIIVVSDANISIKRLSMIAMILISISTTIYSASTDKNAGLTTDFIPDTMNDISISKPTSNNDGCE